MSECLWRPSEAAAREARISRFARRVGIEGSYRDLWRWSVEQPEAFWREMWDEGGVIGERGGQTLLTGDHPTRTRFFPQARLNFAENLLRSPDGSPAIVFVGEDGRREEVSRSDLCAQAAAIASALREAGVGPGDRVAAMVANTPQTAAAMLGAASIGAVWSSCSPDFGVSGVLDRFGQIEPKALFATTGYYYGGRTVDIRSRIAEVAAGLPSLRQTVVWDYAALEPADVPSARTLEEFTRGHQGAAPEYAALEFSHPLYVLFSSGTTGKPKCIVHSAGGILLQHLKEHLLHCGFGAGDRVFYFTTCGWMMWNWLVSALAVRSTIVLYDGNPMHPSPGRLPALARDERFDVFGTSAKYLDAAFKAGVRPLADGPLPSLRTVLSTGSPLSADGFRYVYRDWKEDLHLGSISGGTDICGVFVGANPAMPVHAGEIQCPYLGLDVRVYGQDGQPVVGEPGELVCQNAHPSMPLGFWGDDDGSRYRAAYFSPWPDIWRHGDWMVETERGSYSILGRSDATLNPGGVRIGTAEIYRQAEGMPEVVESLAIGQEWEGDVRVVLFVRLAEGVALDGDLQGRIRAAIREGASPRHVPARIVAVADIPRTRSGKIVELAVRDVVHGREVRNSGALANPEALELFRDLAELAD